MQPSPPAVMSTTTKDRGPVPLDPFGNEVCWLFLKHGKCRYKKKCKKSHILPDKNAPLMQQVTPTVTEQPPIVNAGPKIAFEFKKAPSKKPNRFSGTPDQQTAEPAPAQSASYQGTAYRGENVESHKTAAINTVASTTTTPVDPESTSIALQEDPQARKRPSSSDTLQEDLWPSKRPSMSPALQENPRLSKRPSKRPSAPRPKRLPKERLKYLLGSLFTSSIPDSAVQEKNRPPSNIPTREGTRPSSRVAGKSEASQHSGRDSRLSAASAPYSTNEAGVSGEKVEQWYITNKAHLDPKSRRLMILSKPTTARQTGQLKAMRKHHWECRTEIEYQLKRNTPATYSLKIARDRIDWERVAPYVTLMIQAAFQMDSEHQHLPIFGKTLCMLLEHKDLSGTACEKILVSWGLTDIDARRFSSNLWDVMVAAAGEADIRGAKGCGLRVRHYEGTKEFKCVRDRLVELNKPPS